MLLAGSYFFQTAITYMAGNIADFENVALPPKKQPKKETFNPILKIDATSKELWTLVDFKTGQSSQIKDPEKDRELIRTIPWDIGFQRTKIITNSGATNQEGRVGIIDMGQVDFDSVRLIPTEGFIEDQRRWGNILNPAISKWYNYRTRTHNVESKKSVYLLRTDNGRHAKFRILNYYCTHEEEECSSVMCNRDEAACLTIEYMFQKGPGFPPSPKEVSTLASTATKTVLP